MTANPNGFVQIYDFGQPKVITGKAIETISGGQFVGCSGAEDVVSSDTSSFTNTDVEFIICDDSENFVGVAIGTATSGNKLAVSVDAVILARVTDDAVLAGRLVKAISGADAVTTLGSQALSTGSLDASTAGNIAGRALTAGASGNFALVHIKP